MAGRFWRGMTALLLAAVVLWVSAVSAGSENAAEAVDALQKAYAVRLLHWELGDLWTYDRLSPAAALTLRVSPLLCSARRNVAALWEQQKSEEDRMTGENTAPLLVTQAQNPIPQVQEASASDDALSSKPDIPAEEPPLPENIPPAPSADNGVAAQTLVPTDLSGYIVSGKVCVHNATSYSVSPESIAEPYPAALSEEAPQLLIIHTHGSEAYTPAVDSGIVWSGDHRTTDPRYNVVGVGDIMAEVLSQAGISVLHDRTLYDYPAYSGAYDRSLQSIQNYLAQYPSIHFILDIHRDAVEDSSGNEYKVVSEVEGRMAAQMSLVVGSDGSGLEHPHWRDNLRLAAALQQHILESYPTLMRPVVLRNSRYNQHATTGSLLVEVGAAGNAPEEAALAGRLLAENIAELLRK